MTATDTIFALSSGAGRAAIAIIRISGPDCALLLEQLANGIPPPRSFALRTLRHPSSGEILDRAVVVWLPAPRSFTGEDCIELQVHASPAVIGDIMAFLGSHSGVRPAEPGEFTRRAYLNGRMDLVEAEGLADLLEARTSGQRRQAMRQMSGLASSVFDGWRQELLLIRADVEAVVDFADEPGVAEAAAPGIDIRIGRLLADMSAALEGAGTSEIIRDGVRVVLAGAPNTGKSSLLNFLARREAAIVSDMPGTTRDAIEVSLDIGGIPVILTDTAGIRDDASDRVEEEGIRRSRDHISRANIVVWLWSADVTGSKRSAGQDVDLVVRNKCDLGSPAAQPGELAISTRTGEGVPVFVDALTALLRDRYGHVESSLVVSERQKSALRGSIRHLNDSLRVRLDQLELKAEHIRLASEDIGRLTGKIGVEEWLGAIFSRFCIGK